MVFHILWVYRKPLHLEMWPCLPRPTFNLERCSFFVEVSWMRGKKKEVITKTFTINPSQQRWLKTCQKINIIACALLSQFDCFVEMCLARKKLFIHLQWSQWCGHRSYLAQAPIETSPASLSVTAGVTRPTRIKYFEMHLLTQCHNRMRANAFKA